LPNIDQTNIPEIKIVNKQQFDDEHWDLRILKPKLKTWSQEQHVSQFVHENMQAIRTEMKLSVVSERPGLDKKALLQFANPLRTRALEYWKYMRQQVDVDGMDFSGSILGMHIRRTDMQKLMLDRNHRTWDDYDELDHSLFATMHKHLVENPTGAIYIATDSKVYYTWLKIDQVHLPRGRFFFGPHHHNGWLNHPLGQVPKIGNAAPLRCTSVPDFAVELLLLTKCDKLLLSKESTVTSLLRSLVPDTHSECMGTMQPTAHLKLLPGTEAEYRRFFLRNKKMLNYENRISQPWLNLTPQLWGFLLDIPRQDLLNFHEKVLQLCIVKGDGANNMPTQLLGLVPGTPASIIAARFKYHEVCDDIVSKFASRKKSRSWNQSSSSVSQEDSTKPAKFWKSLFWTRLLQLSRQLSLPMFIHDGDDLRLVKTDACIQELQSTCSGKKHNGVKELQDALAKIVCAKLTAQEVSIRAQVCQQQLDSWAADQGEGEDDAITLDNEFCLGHEGMAVPVSPPSPELAQKHWPSQDNWPGQNNSECRKRQRRC
jgi:hypothetical protein